MNRYLQGVLLGITGLAAFGCSGPTNDVFLVGQAYDGASGARLTNYTMSVVYRDQTINAEVDKDGRFIVKHLPVFQDYTVQIDAEGYRTFRSHNGMFNLPNPNSPDRPESSTQTYYYDAYLFPTALQASAVSLTIRKDTSTGEMATGKVRIRPTSESVLADSNSETPAGVGVQEWTNDEDLQAPPINKDFSNGKVDIAAGELVYGVHYQVSVYEVDGYQPLEGTITAGIDSQRTMVVSPEMSDPLALVSNTVATCTKPTGPTDTAASVVSFTFNLPVELSTSTYAGGVDEMIDDNFFISWPDTAAPVSPNALAADASTTVLERGTSITTSGNTLTLSWNANVGLATKDANDTFGYTRWNILNVQVQPVGKSAQKVYLTSLYPSGAGYITCQ